MKLYFFGLNVILSIALLSCNSVNKNIKPDSDWKYVRDYYDSTNTIKHHGPEKNGKPIDIHYWYYPSGNINIVFNHEGGEVTGKRFQFFDSTELIIQNISTFSDGLFVDTSFFFDINGKMIQYNIYTKKDSIVKKVFFHNNGNKAAEKTFVKTDIFKGTYVNGYIYYDTLGNIEEEISNYYELIEPNKTYFKDSLYEIKVKYTPFFGKKFKFIYGENINETYSYDEDKVEIIKTKTPFFSFPLNTKEKGVKTIRFIIIDMESWEKNIEYKKTRYLFGEYKYKVD